MWVGGKQTRMILYLHCKYPFIKARVGGVKGLVSRRAGVLGFSLIEVVVSLGIVATVLVALLAMVGIGTNTMRDAADLTAEARVVEDVLGDVQLADWDDVERLDGEVRYYDDQGLRMRARSVDVSYAAQVDVAGDGVVLPGAGKSRYLRKVRVKVGTFPGGLVDFGGRAGEGRWREVTTWVVDLQKERAAGRGDRR